MSRHAKYYSRTDSLYPECSLYVSRILAGYYRYDYRMIPVWYVRTETISGTHRVHASTEPGTSKQP